MAKLRGRSKAAPYSITSSARPSSVGGTSSPSALAVLRLIVTWYLVAAWHWKVSRLLALQDAKRPICDGYHRPTAGEMT
jgi:hypothetical protein